MRNESAHDNIDADFNHAFEAMDRMLRAIFELKKNERHPVVDSLLAHRDEHHPFTPASDVLDDMLEEARRSQDHDPRAVEEFSHLTGEERGRGKRWLYAAPAGSGKTLIAIKLASEWLRVKK